MFERIKSILMNYTEVDESVIAPEANLQEDLDLNSLDVMNIVMEFEDTFGIEIADSDVSKMLTVRDVEEYLVKKIG